MSKIIESIKTAKDFSKKQGAEETFMAGKKSGYEMTQEQLADIYFSGSEKVKKSEYPMVIKVIEKPKAASYAPWIITSLAFLIMAFSLFSTKRIFVDIKVIDDKNLALMQQSSPAQIGSSETFAKKEGRVRGAKVSFQDFVFEGAGRLKSMKDGSGLTLVNSSVAPFARANLRLKSPLDLSACKIVFYVKGQRGGENITFGLKDKGNIPAFDKGTLNPFPDGLTTNWQKAEIPIVDTAEEFNEKSVMSMRFEYGSKETKNKPGDTILVKDLQVVSL